MKPIRIVQVGMGHMGKAWLSALRAHPDAEAAAWVDPDRPALEALARQGLLAPDRCFARLEDALARVPADAVLVATPPELHEEACVQAAQKGLHILCEKPLAHSLESARRAVEASERAGVVLQVAQNRRHADFIHTLRRRVRERPFGRPGQAYVTFRHHFTRDSFRDRMEHPLLVDMANHHFDAIRCVFAAEPAGVQGIAWNPYWSRFRGPASAVLVFDYADGLRVVYQGSWHTVDADKTSNGCDWRIECEGGAIGCENEQVFEIAAGGRRIPVASAPMPKQYGGYLLDEWIRAVRGGAPPETTGRDNLGTLAMVFGAVRAVDRGGRIALPPG